MRFTTSGMTTRPERPGLKRRLQLRQNAFGVTDLKDRLVHVAPDQVTREERDQVSQILGTVQSADPCRSRASTCVLRIGQAAAAPSGQRLRVYRHSARSGELGCLASGLLILVVAVLPLEYFVVWFAWDVRYEDVARSHGLLTESDFRSDIDRAARRTMLVAV
jgi:hypothetical protein